MVSENVHRRHLTMAQCGLLVRELYLPQAREEAAVRIDTARKREPLAAAKWQEPIKSEGEARA